VVLESLDAGVPVIAFEGSGGSCALLADGYGLLAPFGDTRAMAQLTLDLLSNPARRNEMGEAGRQRVKRDFSYRRYGFDMAALADPGIKRVSVIVPNFNYARYIEQRIVSIAEQSRPVYEIIALDDGSSDNSPALMQDALAQTDIDSEFVQNSVNSGSACRQWLNGVARARGEIVWIAEADDLCEPEFLEEVLPAFDDPDVCMAYCQSQQMGPNDEILDVDYLTYVSDLGRDRWTKAHVVDGSEALSTWLSVKNAVPNVSACLFRREALVAALSQNIDEIAQYRVVGDWATYAYVLAQGKLAFFPRALNKHRRHPNSVTIGSFNEKLLREILSMQRTLRLRHNPPPAWIKRSRDYAQELYVQFGLHSDAAPDVLRSPSFEDYFK
jgi:glycosyltransferase involved in cell wall biosynthesis